MLQNVILNEAETLKTWGSFITESTGVTDRSKLTWMSKYCAFHDMNEKQNLNESALGYAHLNPNMNVGGMGAPYFPGANPNNGYDGVRGSGDNPFSLLPLAVQVAAQTIALDLVPVVPMQGPLGILQYMDYVYEGGKTNLRPRFEGAWPLGDESKTAPLMVKLTLSLGDSDSDSELENALGDAAHAHDDAVNHAKIYRNLQEDFKPGAPVTIDGIDAHYELVFVALGRIDGRPIFQVKEKPYFAYADPVNGGEGADKSLADTLFSDGVKVNGKYYVVDIDTVKALEDFIPGFSGAGFKNGDPMSAKSYDRATGESTPSNMMSLNTFTLKVEAKTIQVKGAITREQIQDLKAYGIDAVAQVEAELVNELTQHINREILDEIFALGDQNHYEAAAFEGINLNTYFTVDPREDPNAHKGYCVSFVGGGAETLGTIQRRIMSKILAASNLIAQRGRRGAGTFAVCSASIATALQDCAGFVAYPLSNTINQNAGSLYPVGAISGVSIYVDPNMAWANTKIVVGRKGKDNEPGLVFMPYLMADKLSYPAEGMEGAPVTSLKSRYAIVRAGHHPQLYFYSFDIQLGNGVSLI